MTDSTGEFRAAMIAAGLTPPGYIVPDGKLHRCPSNGVARDDAGWYVYHDGVFQAGAFGDWRTGLRQTWRANSARRLSLSERAALQASARASKANHEFEKALGEASGARRAAVIWKRSAPAGDNPYLSRKGIPAFGTRLYGGALVIPLSDADGRLWNLQFIAADGKKRFLKTARVGGCFYGIQGSNDDTIVICEGFATAASLHRATGHTCIMAVTAGNLLNVAQAMRAKHPGARLIVCADNDAGTEARLGTNPGITAATAAAKAVDALLCVPSFKSSEVIA